MITLQTTVHVADLRGQQIFDFFMRPDDATYRRWWPGTHLAFHELGHSAGDMGRRLLMDEFVGRRRVRLAAVVVEAEASRLIVWQLEKGVRLPVWVRFELVDDPQGVSVTHTILAGYVGRAAVFDNAMRLFFDEVFARDMDDHVRTEFPKLRPLLVAVDAAC